MKHTIHAALLVFALLVSPFAFADPNVEPFTQDQMRSLIQIREVYASLSAERMGDLDPAPDTPPQPEWMAEFFAGLSSERLFLSRFEASRRPDGEVEMELVYSYIGDTGKQHEKRKMKILGKLTPSGVKLYSF